MKRLSRFNTVYYKLVTSYAILIFVSISALGVSSYWYFSKNFNEQIEKVNVRMLHHLSDMIDRNAIRRTEQLYVDIVMDQPRNSDLMIFFDQPLAGNHSKLLEANRYLTQMVTANDDLVESIEIFYRNTKAVLSSGGRGYSQLNEELAGNNAWIEQMERSGINTLWLRADGQDTADSAETEQLLFVRAYPFAATAGKASGFVSIRLKPDAITRYLEPEGSSDRSTFFLLDPHGNLMVKSKGDGRLAAEQVDSLNMRINGMDESEGNFLGNYGTSSIASYTTLGQSGWRLVNLTPVDQYYRKSIAIRNTFLIICLAAISIGMLLSNIFTLRIYNPLKLLMHRLRSSAQTAVPAFGNKGENELQTIDHVINHLTLKVTELERTFEDNMPLIKHHLVTGLMQQAFTRQEEYEEMLRLLKLNWQGSYYTALIMELDPVQISSLSAENAQFIQYSLVSQIEENSGGGASFLATALSHYRVGVILATNSGDLARVHRIAQQVTAYIRENYMLSATAAFGSWVIFPLDLHLSYTEAQTALSYKYFLPENGILSGPELMEREHSGAVIDEAVFAGFSQLLKSGSYPDVKAFVRNFLAQVSSGPYSAEHGHQRIRELVGEFRGYLRELHIPYKELFPAEAWESFRHIRHIRQMEEWLLSCVQAVFLYLESKQKARGSDVIDELRRYVQDCYRADISLESAASHVSLSPRYLSKVFKDETGMNFTDYVTQIRLAKAMELITGTDDTVEQISRLCGFNSSGYFIKKFKEHYGVTPKMYKSLEAAAQNPKQS
ncbi:helix-turn-helix domain-containing protein [Paenibacillus sp. YN15]|uniref:helix-turn-helix domain-containing protein n=1 Tax=Paenibacillus sp. YN15 TaxID=1742774 RepID=UPI0015EC479D|nr:helix-turn-helix domain-containing protein [Paenibacillus sp. YN15]